ncbi:MAG: DUF2568 domain-containing protein [Mycobacteriales bacterium]
MARFIVGVTVPLVVTAGWAHVMAPRARRRVPWPARPVVALVLFLLAALALADRGHSALAAAFAVVAVAKGPGSSAGARTASRSTRRGPGECAIR